MPQDVLPRTPARAVVNAEQILGSDHWGVWRSAQGKHDFRFDPRTRTAVQKRRRVRSFHFQGVGKHDVFKFAPRTAAPAAEGSGVSQGPQSRK